MRKLFFPMMVVMLSAAAALAADGDAPWWRQEKIRFMWGQWAWARKDKSKSFLEGELPRSLFRDVARAGGTVYVEHRAYCNLTHARYAHEFGMKYFATQYVHRLPTLVPGGRKWVQQSGKGHWFKCPLEEEVYAKWLVEPYLEGVRAGLVDGIHVDWENYGGRGEAKGICYCDDCFATFLSRQGKAEDPPEKIARFGWLEKQRLVQAYEKNFHERRVEMFTRFRETLQAANPDFLFSSYNMLFSDFSEAMTTARTPFIVIDSRHYINDDRQAWWESYGAWLRSQGYLYLPGGWTNALFGAQPSEVSAARWIYEASINEDGCWLWFERELDDEILRAYATADREIQAVLGEVGTFLFNGARDANFATTVEWTGRPELSRAVVSRTYHLDGEHLMHVNNVHSEWPLRVRLRFPRLPAEERWTVREPLHGLFYTRDGTSVEWTRDDLLAGVVVAMEPRTDLFLLVSASAPDLAVEPARLIHSREFSALPDHDAASKAAGPPERIVTLYRMKNAIYEQALETLLAATEEMFSLPKGGWRFRMDPEDIGAGENWYLPATPTDDWIEIETEAFWGSKGGTGAGWYCRNVDVPALPEGKRVYLHFGAVDEHLVLWIDGEYAGDYDREPGEGWDQPFAVDVTGRLTGGSHRVAMRVHNVGGAGGVWKRVSVRVGGEIGDADRVSPEVVPSPALPGGLLYTATEPMGFEGAEGGLTIGNVIRAIDSGGDKQERLRQLRGHLWSPSYSPDGERIVFVHDAGGRGQVYVMNADGSDPKDLSSNDYCDRSPVWSPDGTRIAFVSDRTGDWDIYVMNADGPAGAPQRRLAGNPGLDRAPDWSPDGRRVAWESHVTGMPNIWAVGADGSDPRPLIDPDAPLEIREVRSWNDPLEIVDLEPRVPENTFALMDPVWSPDGECIAVVGLPTTESGHVLAVLSADGSSMLHLFPWIPFLSDVAWSPDGKLLAAAYRLAPSESERSGVLVIESDGTGTKQGEFLVDVTPAGPRLGGARRHGLMSWYSHGSAQPRRVVKTFTSLAWSPDGRTLAFSSDMDATGAFYVHTIPADGGEPARIESTKSAWPNEITWRPRSMH